MLKKVSYFFIVLFLFVQGIESFAAVTIGNSQYFLNEVNQSELSASYLFEYKFNSNVKFKLEPYTKLISQEKQYFQFNELNLQVKKEGIVFKVGFGVTEWEGTDFINPMDFTNPKNYQDPLSPFKISQLNLNISGQNENLSYDFVFIPKQETAKLPGEKSLWWPREYAIPSLEKNTVLLLPEDVEYQIDEPVFQKGVRENNLALRLQYLGENKDFTLAFYDGMSVMPKLNPIITVVPIEVSPQTIYQLQSPIEIVPSYYRHRVMAFAYVQTVKDMILRLSANHSQPILEGKNLDLWSQLTVISLEKNLPNVTFLFQAVASKRPESTEISLVSSLLDKSVMAGFRWPINDKLSWYMAAFQEQTNYSYYLKSDLKYMWTESLQQVFGFDVLEGSKTSLLGAFNKNDRISTKLSYLF